MKTMINIILIGILLVIIQVMVESCTPGGRSGNYKSPGKMICGENEVKVYYVSEGGFYHYEDENGLEFTYHDGCVVMIDKDVKIPI